MNDLTTLIQQSLDAADRLRQRQTEPYIWCYIGATPVSGELAEPPSERNNLRRIRKNDPKPVNTIHWSDNYPAVKWWFDAHTVQTGVNVWRWK